MNALEWNPAFGPVATAVIVLLAGVYFYFLLQRLIPRHGKNLSWLLLIPKVLIVALLIVALLDPELVLSGGNSNPAKVLICRISPPRWICAMKAPPPAATAAPVSSIN